MSTISVADALFARLLVGWIIDSKLSVIALNNSKLTVQLLDQNVCLFSSGAILILFIIYEN